MDCQQSYTSRKKGEKKKTSAIVFKFVSVMSEYKISRPTDLREMP